MTAAVGASVVVGVAVIAVARAAARAVPPIRPRLGVHRPLTPDRPGEGAPSAGASARATPAGPAVVGVALVLAVFVLGVVWAVVGCVVIITARAVMTDRRRERRMAAVDRAVPDLVDLLALAAAVGHPVRSCIDVVADRSPVELRGALVRVRRRCRRGVPLRTALEDLTPELGTQGPALVEALIAAHQTGAPLAGPLAHLAASGRDLRRRSAEARARRLPVTLLFPLVCCILPAFALLAVVPLLAGSLSALRP